MFTAGLNKEIKVRRSDIRRQSLNGREKGQQVSKWIPLGYVNVPEFMTDNRLIFNPQKKKRNVIAVISQTRNLFRFFAATTTDHFQPSQQNAGENAC